MKPIRAVDSEPQPQEASPGGVGSYLETLGLGPDVRQVLTSGGSWSESMQGVALRLLARLENAPRSSESRWRSEAHVLDATSNRADASRGMVRVSGRASHVKRIRLSEQDAALHDRRFFDVVRLETDQGWTADILTGKAPEEWVSSVPLLERSEAVGLVVGPGPIWQEESSTTPADATDRDTPSRPATILLVSSSIAWFPETTLGDLGMDYALFEGVQDGRGLEPSEADAFYASLAAAGRVKPSALRQASASASPDIVTLINPAEKWIAAHRGQPVAISGTARRATRITVDSPERRREIGSDHYWELFVFVDTPLLEIDGRVQQSYPVVCCVRSLPEGMPSGEDMTESVDVSGFAFKRYRYATSENGLERESPLLIGNRPTWHPAPRPTASGSPLTWVLTGLAVLTAVALVGFAWLAGRDTRRAERDHARSLPERFDPPAAV